MKWAARAFPVGQIADSPKHAGRFAADFGGKGNIAIIQAGIHHALTASGIDETAVFPIWYSPCIVECSQLFDSKGLKML